MHMEERRKYTIICMPSLHELKQDPKVDEFNNKIV